MPLNKGGQIFRFDHAKIWSRAMTPEVTLPVVGLLGERRRLVDALNSRESLLLIGPRGCGKTAVIRAAIAASSRREDVIYLRYSSGLHELLFSLAFALLQAGHQYIERTLKNIPDAKKWLAQQTSVHLRGLLWNALETDPRTIVLDGVDGASHPVFRFMQRLYFAPGMTMYAAARDSAALGALSRLFWHPQKIIHFQPLSHTDATELFELAVDAYHLRELDISEFRQKVLDSAAGNPGQIVEMCRLAADPQYIAGRYVKFAPLRIDAMLKFL